MTVGLAPFYDNDFEEFLAEENANPTPIASQCRQPCHTTSYVVALNGVSFGVNQRKNIRKPQNWDSTGNQYISLKTQSSETAISFKIFKPPARVAFLMLRNGASQPQGGAHGRRAHEHSDRQSR